MKRSLAILLSFALVLSCFCGLSFISSSAEIIDVIDDFSDPAQTYSNWEYHKVKHLTKNIDSTDTTQYTVPTNPITVADVTTDNSTTVTAPAGEIYQGSYTGFKPTVTTAGYCGLTTQDKSIRDQKAAAGRTLTSFKVESFFPIVATGYSRSESSAIVPYLNEATGAAVYIVPNYESNSKRIQMALQFGIAESRTSMQWNGTYNTTGNGFYGNGTYAYTYLCLNNDINQPNPTYVNGGGIWMRTTVDYAYTSGIISGIYVNFDYYDNYRYENKIASSGEKYIAASNIITVEKTYYSAIGDTTTTAAVAPDFLFGIAGTSNTTRNAPLFRKATVSYSKSDAEAAAQFKELNNNILQYREQPATLPENKAEAAVTLYNEYGALTSGIKTELAALNVTAEQMEGLYFEGLRYLYVNAFLTKYDRIFNLDLSTAVTADYEEMLEMQAEYDALNDTVKSLFTDPQKEKIKDLYFAALVAIPSNATLAFQAYYNANIAALDATTVTEEHLDKLNNALTLYYAIESNYKPVAENEYKHICNLAYTLKSDTDKELLMVEDTFDSAVSNGLWDIRNVQGWSNKMTDTLLSETMLTTTAIDDTTSLLHLDAATAGWNYITLKDNIWDTRPGRIKTYEVDSYIPYNSSPGRDATSSPVIYYDAEYGNMLRLTFHRESSSKIQVGLYTSTTSVTNGLYSSAGYSTIGINASAYASGMWVRSKLTYNYNTDGTLNTIDFVFGFYNDGAYTGLQQSIPGTISNANLLGGVKTLNPTATSVPGDFTVGLHSPKAGCSTTALRFDRAKITFSSAVYTNPMDDTFDGASLGELALSGESMTVFGSVYMPKYADAVLFSKGDAATGWRYALQADGKARFTIAGENYVTDSVVYEPDSRADLAIVFNQGYLSLYKDTECVLRSHTAKTLDNAGEFTLGSVDGAELTDLRIYNIALAAEDIANVIATPVWAYETAFNNNTRTIYTIGSAATYGSDGIKSTMVADSERWSYVGDITYDTSATTGDLYFVSKGSVSNSPRVAAQVSTGGYIYVSGGAAGGTGYSSGQRVFAAGGESTHRMAITVVRYGCYTFRVSVYADGAYVCSGLVNAESATYPDIHSTKELAFGRLPGTCNPYMISNMKIWNKELTAEEIGNEYSTGTIAAAPESTYSIKNYTEESVTVFAPEASDAKGTVGCYYKDANGVLTLKNKLTVAEALAAGDNLLNLTALDTAGANWLKLFVWRDGSYQDILCESMAQPLYLLSFSGASLTLTSDFSINYKVLTATLNENGFQNPYVAFVHKGNQIKVSDSTVNGNYTVFSFGHISPQMMNDKITATLHATAGGNPFVSETVDYSVLTYCRNMMNTYAETEGEAYANFRTLLADILQYGTLAQNYLGYNEDSLANSGMTETEKSWGTATAPTLNSVLNTAYATVESPRVTWMGAGLRLDKSVTLRLKVAADNITGLRLRIVTAAGEASVQASNFVPTEGGYYIYFTGLNAGQMRDTLYLTICDGNTAVSDTVTYSVESYAAAKQSDSDKKLVNLLNAMMNYGDSARRFNGN